MARARLYETVQGRDGSVLANATVTVRTPGTSTPILATIYAANSGASTLPNPITVGANGAVELYLDVAQRVDLYVQAVGMDSWTLTNAPVINDPSDLVHTTGAETLVGKTLSSPAINSPTIIGGTISGVSLEDVSIGSLSDPLLLPDGSESAPSLANTDDPNTGMYWPSADHLEWVTGGTGWMQLDDEGNLFVGGYLSIAPGRPVVPVMLNAATGEVRADHISVVTRNNPGQYNTVIYEHSDNADGYEPVENVTVGRAGRLGTVIAHWHAGASVQDAGGAGIPDGRNFARILFATSSQHAASPTSFPSVFGIQTTKPNTTEYNQAETTSLNQDADFHIGRSLAKPGTGYRLSAEKDPGNGPAYLLRLAHMDDPASGETGQEIQVGLYMRGTADSGVSFADVEAARLAVTKVSDFFGASAADHDARLLLSTMSNGVLTEALRLEAGRATVANGLTVTAGTLSFPPGSTATHGTQVGTSGPTTSSTSFSDLETRNVDVEAGDVILMLFQGTFSTASGGLSSATRAALRFTYDGGNEVNAGAPNIVPTHDTAGTPAGAGYIIYAGHAMWVAASAGTKTVAVQWRSPDGVSIVSNGDRTMSVLILKAAGGAL